MKLGFVLALGAFIVADLSPVHALDCAQASERVDKLICATPKLKQADAAMSAAFFKLLRETTDREFHDALVQSQRRWLKERSHSPDRYGQAEGDTTDDREVLLDITRDRLARLQAGRPIRTMEEERKIAAKDGGGLFAGYKTSCFILPPPYGSWNYGCFGDVHRQHDDRICSVGIEWASGHTTEKRLAGVLKNGVPRPVASCSTGYAGTSEQCPDPDSDAETKAVAHWNTNPGSSEHAPPPQGRDLWKYDPDVDPDVADQQWVRDCLFAPVFPPPDVSRADPASEK